MRKDQLDILLKDGDIMTMDFIYKEAHKWTKNYYENNRFTVNIKGVDYAIDIKIIDTLSSLYNCYVDIYCRTEKERLEGDIKAKLEVYSTAKEDIIEWYNELILKQYSRLNNLMGEVTHCNSIQYKQATWIYSILDRGPQLIQCLKFDVLNGEKIDGTSHVDSPNFKKLREYFETDKISKYYNITAAAENIKYLKELIKQLEQPAENDDAQKLQLQSKKGNDYSLSTIEDYLIKFKEKMNDHYYHKLISALKEYFETGQFPKSNEEIKISKVNIKSFGWALNQIYRSQKKDALAKEYLIFAKENISLFKDIDFNEKKITDCRLYDYFTTKTL